MIKIYHNPRCSKSRQALEIINNSGSQFTVIEYLKEKLVNDDLKKIIDDLGLKPREIMRVKEDIYKELNLSDKNISDDKLIDVIIKNPILLERPIIVSGKGTVIARPPELVEDLL